MKKMSDHITTVIAALNEAHQKIASAIKEASELPQDYNTEVVMKDMQFTNDAIDRLYHNMELNNEFMQDLEH